MNVSRPPRYEKAPMKSMSNVPALMFAGVSTSVSWQNPCQPNLAWGSMSIENCLQAAIASALKE